jgi:hypothetical protein
MRYIDAETTTPLTTRFTAYPPGKRSTLSDTATSARSDLARPFLVGYKPFREEFHRLFNSYYISLGEEIPEKKPATRWQFSGIRLAI